MPEISDIVERFRSYNNNTEEAGLIVSAYDVARQAHDGQLRKSKEPYIIHPLAVAYTLTTFEMDWEVICAALLHDTIEDTNLKFDQIQSNFGKGVAELVESLTNIKTASRIQESEKEAAEIENLRKIILGTTQDLRVILIKLADRWDNLKSIKFLTRDRQKSIARESLAIYAPFANHLGLSIIKREIEVLCFKVLKPRLFMKYSQRLTISKRFLYHDVLELKRQVNHHLSQASIPSGVYERYKTPYRIYLRTLQNLQPQTVDINVITETVRDAYTALGVIHQMLTPLSGSTINDFISIPRSNGYQALHTKVLFRENIYNIQIRTQVMDQIANYGILAKVDGRPAEEYKRWISLLKDLASDEPDSRHFMREIKDAAEADRIYVCTPKGDYWSFPPNAIVLDFAYRVHTDVGNRTQAAIIDNQITDIYDELRDGALVKIITSPDVNPKTEWLNKVKTPRARTAIRNWLDNQKKIRSRDFGRKILSLEMERFNLSLDQIENSEEFPALLEKLNTPDAKDLYQKVGRGLLTPRQIISHLVSAKDLNKVLKKEKSMFNQLWSKIFKDSNDRVFQIRDINDVFIKLSKCCNPLPGDHIIGILTARHGMSIHRSDCTTLKHGKRNLENIIQLTWDLEKVDRKVTRFALRTDKNPKILSELVRILTHKKLNIVSLNYENKTNGCIIEMEIETLNADQAELILRIFGETKGVSRAQRL